MKSHHVVALGIVSSLVLTSGFALAIPVGFDFEVTSATVSGCNASGHSGSLSSVLSIALGVLGMALARRRSK
jgi:MYXO-CTERM domain-containing protein